MSFPDFQVDFKRDVNTLESAPLPAGSAASIEDCGFIADVKIPASEGAGTSAEASAIADAAPARASSSAVGLVVVTLVEV